MRSSIILNFHGIGTPHAGVPESEKPYWISADFFERIVRHILDDGRGDRIFLTFDDGNSSDVDIAAPILRDHGMTGRFFVLTGRLGAAHYLGPRDVQSLVDMGMAVGLHGADHLDWRTLDDDALERETVQARTALASVVGKPVNEVAIPFGAYDRRVMRRLLHQGFATIFTSDGGRTSTDARIKARTSVHADMTLGSIDAIIDGREPLRRRMRRGVSTFLRRHVV